MQINVMIFSLVIRVDSFLPQTVLNFDQKKKETTKHELYLISR